MVLHLKIIWSFWCLSFLFSLLSHSVLARDEHWLSLSSFCTCTYLPWNAWRNSHFYYSYKQWLIHASCAINKFWLVWCVYSYCMVFISCIFFLSGGGRKLSPDFIYWKCKVQLKLFIWNYRKLEKVHTFSCCMLWTIKSLYLNVILAINLILHVINPQTIFSIILLSCG